MYRRLFMDIEREQVKENIRRQEHRKRIQRYGPGCSKLTMSLVNVLLKFQMLISNIQQYVVLKKCEKLFQQKISVCLVTKS